MQENNSLLGIHILIMQRVGGIPPEELNPLVEEARAMKLHPDSLLALQDALKKAKGWQARAERLFKGGKSSMTLVQSK